MDSPGINYPPAVWFVVPGLVAWLVGRKYPLPIVPETLAPALFTAGCVLVTTASVLLVWALATAGFGLVLDSWWMLLVAPLALAAVSFFVVRREEAYLTEKFGEQYVSNTRRVRRRLQARTVLDRFPWVVGARGLPRAIVSVNSRHWRCHRHALDSLRSLRRGGSAPHIALRARRLRFGGDGA